MLPQGNITNLKVIRQMQPSRTYKLDLGNKRISGHIDGIEAVKQSAIKILSTERYKYHIYSWSYGVELNNLICKERNFIKSELERRIEEALTTDERITGINNFSVDVKGDTMVCTFNVQSTEGNYQTSYTFDK